MRRGKGTTLHVLFLLCPWVLRPRAVCRAREQQRSQLFHYKYGRVREDGDVWCVSKMMEFVCPALQGSPRKILGGGGS